MCYLLRCVRSLFTFSDVACVLLVRCVVGAYPSELWSSLELPGQTQSWSCPDPLRWEVGYLCVVGKKFVVVVVVGFCFALLKSCKDARPMVVPLIVFQHSHSYLQG